MSKVHIVEDESTVLDTIVKLTKSAGYYCESYSVGTELLENTIGPDECVVSDFQLPDMTGLDLMRSLRARGQASPVLLITGFATIDLAVEAMKEGAIDFLAKPFRKEELLGKLEMCSAIGRVRARQRQRHIDARRRLETLTPREAEVLACVMDGKQNKNIAWELQVSIKTIEVHRSRIMGKTGASSMIDLGRIWERAAPA